MTMPLKLRAFAAIVTPLAKLAGNRPFEQARARSDSSMAGMGRVLVPGAQVGEVTEHRADGPDGGEVPVRVYRPSDGGGDRPVIVYTHGGGWVFGSPEARDRFSRLLTARTGAVVVAVTYRLAPEHPFPAAVEDAYAATVWAAKHAAELGGDPARLVTLGESAGGNLAAAVPLLARDRGGPAIALQVLLCPSLDLTRSLASHVENADGYMLTAKQSRRYSEAYVPDPAQRRDPYASPMFADHADLPPAVVITAERDPLRDDGDVYAARLEQAGVPVTHRCFTGMIHDFVAMPRLAGAAADQAMDLIVEAVTGR